MSVLLLSIAQLLFGLVVAAVILGGCYLAYDLCRWWRSH